MKKLLVIIFCLFAVQAVAQVPVKKDDTLKNTVIPSTPRQGEEREGVREVFGQLEQLISGGAVKGLVGFIGSQVYLDLSGGEHGYFSSNHALSLLENYFVVRKPLSFTFLNVNQRAPSPFATGRFHYQYKGSKESAQVYVALTKRDSTWVMTQFTIY